MRLDIQSLVENKAGADGASVTALERAARNCLRVVLEPATVPGLKDISLFWLTPSGKKAPAPGLSEVRYLSASAKLTGKITLPPLVASDGPAWGGYQIHYLRCVEEFTLALLDEALTKLSKAKKAVDVEPLKSDLVEQFEGVVSALERGGSVTSLAMAAPLGAARLKGKPTAAKTAAPGAVTKRAGKASKPEVKKAAKPTPKKALAAPPKKPRSKS